MRTIATCLREAQKKLAGLSETAKLDSELILANLLGLERVDLITKSASELTEAQYSAYLERINRRAEHEPVAYITSQKSFMDLTLSIIPGVLIPRPDTEILVEVVLSKLQMGNAIGLEIGVGSGAIVLALLCGHENLTMHGVDVSEQALDITRQNAEHYELLDRLTLYHSNLYETIRHRQFDFIVSNPPYISSEEMRDLSTDILEYEPHLALHAGADGLDFYRRIISVAPEFLVDDGLVFLEIGYNQAHAVSDLLKKHGFYDIVVTKDLAGLDRVVSAVKGERCDR